MGTHLRVLSESYLMNTYMTGLDGFQKSLHPCDLEVVVMQCFNPVFMLIGSRKGRKKNTLKILKI